VHRPMDEHQDLLAGTSPYLTLDAINAVRFSQIVAVLEGSQEWSDIMDDDLEKRLRSQGLDDISSRAAIRWDDATLLFTACADLGHRGEGTKLQAGVSPERFGRFPYGDGSPLSYLVEWMRPSDLDGDSLQTILTHLESLQHRVPESMKNGISGLEIRGWLDGEEIKQLRMAMTSRLWVPAADEPLDGGCHDAAKHLLALLRAAEKRRVGVLLRAHI
jgi:hypothetical protein